MSYLDRYPVFRATRRLCEQITRHTADFSRNAVLRDQLRRSTQSALLNLAEGLGRTSPGEERRAYTIAHGELHETRAGLVLASIQGLISARELRDMDDAADKAGAMLWGLIRHFGE